MKKDTKQLLANALIKVAEKKSIDKITIKEIVSECGLSSQTFYNNFQDKYDLLIWVHGSKRMGMMQKLEEGKYSFRDLTIENLTFYMDHADFMANALTNTHGADSYYRKSGDGAFYLMKEYLKKKKGGKDLTLEEEIHLRMYVYSCIDIYAYWASCNGDIPIEKMADLVVDALPETIRGYFAEG